MDLSKVFRFPEEAELEQACIALSKAELEKLLAGWYRDLPQVCTIAHMQKELNRQLERLACMVGTFLQKAHGQIDFFGAATQPAQLYAEYCAFQLQLQQIVFDLRSCMRAPSLPYTLPAGRERILHRLTDNADVEPDIKRIAQCILQTVAQYRAAQAAENERWQEWNIYLDRFLEQTVPVYCERALVLSDARDDGKKMQAGALLALTAELGEAVRSVLHAINHPDTRKNYGKVL